MVNDTLDLRQLWQSVLAELELSLSRANFTTWLKHTAIASVDAAVVVVVVPNGFTQTWLKNKYHADILKTLRRLTNNAVSEIVYRIDATATRSGGGMTVTVTTVEKNAPPILTTTPAGAHTNKETEQQPAATDQTGLNAKYVFESFIVGKNNELAYAACRAVAQKPGKVYNPLFIYGGVGLGKTHLLQAIGRAMLAVRPETQVRYITCEQFTNEFVSLVRSGRSKDFKDVYRNADLLLIDDIQFITGKEGTQEELFHTFNTLHQLDKQVVFTSDRPPKAIPGLEQRMLSRFEWGMIADIAMPDVETRKAIIRSKCDERGIKLDDVITNYIASTVQNNIRELEGALNRVVAFHELNGTKPTLESAKSVLSSLTAHSGRRSVTPRQIIMLISQFYDISLEHLTGSSRKKELVMPRQIAMYLLREEAHCSYPSIGHELGGRDHTTAIHAYEKISRCVEADERLRQELQTIRQRLYAG